MRVTVEAAFVRTVENFPVNQSAISSQPDATCADPAQREGNFVRLIPYIFQVFKFHVHKFPFYLKNHPMTRLAVQRNQFDPIIEDSKPD